MGLVDELLEMSAQAQKQVIAAQQCLILAQSLYDQYLTDYIKEGFDSCIQAFYDHYPKPKMYKRNFNLFNITSINIQNGVAEVEIGPEFISGNPYNEDTGTVYEATIMQGIHGGNFPVKVGVMTYTPHDRMVDWWNENVTTAKVAPLMERSFREAQKMTGF